jgi:Spy/CpxP family protein refolding chaperone
VKKKWLLYLLLALSLGLNAGLLTMDFCGYGHYGRNAWAHRMWDRLRGVTHTRRPPKPPSAAEMIEKRLRDYTEVLNLDESQQQAVREVLQDVIPQGHVLMKKMGENRRSLRKEFAKPDPDPERMRAIAQEWDRLLEQNDELLMRSMLREMEIFTPEQRERYATSRMWIFGGPPPKSVQRPTPAPTPPLPAK